MRRVWEADVEGGGLWLTGAVALVYNTTVQNNVAGFGGAVAVGRPFGGALDGNRLAAGEVERQLPSSLVDLVCEGATPAQPQQCPQTVNSTLLTLLTPAELAPPTVAGVLLTGSPLRNNEAGNEFGAVYVAGRVTP